MKQIITVCNQKGGVGKTTTTANLGAVFAERGKRVLLVDLDPQAALTISMGLDPINYTTHIYHVLLKQATIQEIVIPTQTPNVEIAPSHIDLCGIEADMFSKSGLRLGWEYILARALQVVKNNYDLILIDTPPTFGCLMTNALVAADLVLIPVQCHFLAYRALDWLFPIIEGIQTPEVHPDLSVRLVRTMFDARTLHSNEVAELAAKEHPDICLKSMIKFQIRAADAAIAGQSVVTFDKGSAIASNYRQLAKELEECL